MQAWYKNTLFIALAVSVLLHGLVFFLQQDMQGESAADQLPSVSIQVELAADQPAADARQVSHEMSMQKVVAVEQSQAPVTSANPVRQEAEVSSLPAAENQQQANAEVDTEVPAQQVNRSYHDAGDRADQLRRFVYEAINREKRYPYMAQRQRREGLVKLNFVMHPDGKVTNIAVVQSSRFAILDNAAKQAVQAISPFQLAAEYLSVQHHYNVDIDFRLN